MPDTKPIPAPDCCPVTFIPAAEYVARWRAETDPDG